MLLFLFHSPPLKSWLTFYIGWGHNSNVQWVPRCSENKLELWKSELDLRLPYVVSIDIWQYKDEV